MTDEGEIIPFEFVLQFLIQTQSHKLDQKVFDSDSRSPVNVPSLDLTFLDMKIDNGKMIFRE